MATADHSSEAIVVSLLFGKRKRVAPTLATQYVGTETELDQKPG